MRDEHGKPLYRNKGCSMASIVNHASRTWPTVVTGHPREKSKVVASHINCLQISIVLVSCENSSMCKSTVFHRGHHPDPLSLSTTVLISKSRCVYRHEICVDEASAYQVWCRRGNMCRGDRGGFAQFLRACKSAAHYHVRCETGLEACASDSTKHRPPTGRLDS